MAWKYDEAFDVFFINRVNAICDVYHYYSSIINLPVQDLKELNKLPLLNSFKAERGESFVNLLNVGISRMLAFLKTRCNQEDKEYFKSKKKIQDADDYCEEKYLQDLSDKDFEKVTSPGLKVIDGAQSTKSTLKCFYHEDTYELKIVRDLDNWDNDMISLFIVFELKLLHPSYIHFLRYHTLEKVKSDVAKVARKNFMAILK